MDRNLIAAVKAECLPYSEKQGTDGLAPKKIAPELVKSIFFKDNHNRLHKENFDLFSLEMANGDQLPLSAESVLIHVAEAGKNRKIPLADIIEVSFNGGLNGSILMEGSVSMLRIALVKEKYFFAYLTHKHHLVKLPWDQIAQIQGYNGGFKDRKFNVLAAIEPLEIRNEAVVAPVVFKEVSPAFANSTQLIGFAPEAFDIFEQPLDIQEKKQKIFHKPGVQATIKPKNGDSNAHKN